MKKNGRDLSASMEDYLEAISVLKRKKGIARVKDISRVLKVEPPSVASALKILKSGDFVIHERYGYVDLTPKGEKIADEKAAKADAAFQKSMKK